MAPAKAVVRETSSGKWFSYSSPSAFAFGLSDNGLSDETSSFPYVPGGTTSPNASQANPHGVSQGTRYKIQEEAGDSFTVKCSPDSTASGTGSLNPAGSGYGMVEVTYSASAEPLEVVLDGGIGPKDDKEYLIGQQISASLSTGGLTATTRIWGASGGAPFDSYVANDQNGDYVPLGLSTGSYFTFHFKEPTDEDEPATVSCFVSLSVPTGAQPAGGLTALLNQECESTAPVNTLDADIGTVFLHPTGNPDTVELRDGFYFTYMNGIAWWASAVTPTRFSMMYNGDRGNWIFTQTVIPNRSQTYLNLGYPITETMVYNGLNVLDTYFVYGVGGMNNIHYPDGTIFHSGDGPLQNVRGYTQISINDSFVTYTMYKPPGNGSCYVPLQNLGWSWKAEVDVDSSNQHFLWGDDAEWEWLEHFPTHPEWDKNIKPHLWH